MTTLEDERPTQTSVWTSWLDTATVALFGFLTAVTLGACLVLGAKLQYQSIGSGASAFDGIEVIVMAGLAVLGAPIGIGNVTLSALPLGAVALVGWSIVWGTRRQLREAGIVQERAAVVAGARVGLPLALFSALAAAIFRIGEGPSPIDVNPFVALILGGLWGAAFGALGGWLVTDDLWTRLRRLASRIEERSRLLYEGLVAGTLALVSTFVLAAVFTLLWVIVVLLRGPDDFGWGDAFGALIYMTAFAPNVVISVIALSLGAPIEVGAQVTIDGRVVGPLSDVSLFSGHLPSIAFVLVLIPLLACFVAGYSARRTTRLPKQGAGVLGVTALLYAFVLADLAVLADARLGAGLVRARGFALIAPNPLLVFFMALAWSLVVGFIGWWWADHFLSQNPGEWSGVPAPETTVEA